MKYKGPLAFIFILNSLDHSSNTIEFFFLNVYYKPEINIANETLSVNQTVSLHLRRSLVHSLFLRRLDALASNVLLVRYCIYETRRLKRI